MLLFLSDIGLGSHRVGAGSGSTRDIPAKADVVPVSLSSDIFVLGTKGSVRLSFNKGILNPVFTESGGLDRGEMLGSVKRLSYGNLLSWSLKYTDLLLCFRCSVGSHNTVQ